ncbi:growth factor receptor-bound protein 2 [Plakobranchus ocellatus]|uniref:Growth factor receptor-bound protein 2 n=1 Tax=Plakobranchus ocellatus TaxID=259542 RepID=A0AAV4A3J5_9GAST|nr:growth factor receptor-bound protein 2 [Plakobranchus ocellatus]
MEAIALHTFTATADDELSFSKGQVLKVFGTEAQEDGNWCKAEADGREGMIPSNYIQVKECSWFHGKITRSSAEQTVLKPGQPDGAFLIRESESTPGDFSLTVRFKGTAQHFKVLRDGAGKYFLWVVKFNSLNQLVDYHRTSSVSRTETIYLKDMVLDSATKLRAKFDFTSRGEEEMSISRGDIITLIEKVDSNWWKGKLNGNEGLFPALYVEEISQG